MLLSYSSLKEGDLHGIKDPSCGPISSGGGTKVHGGTRGHESKVRGGAELGATRAVPCSSSSLVSLGCRSSAPLLIKEFSLRSF